MLKALRSRVRILLPFIRPYNYKIYMAKSPESDEAAVWIDVRDSSKWRSQQIGKICLDDKISFHCSTPECERQAAIDAVFEDRFNTIVYDYTLLGDFYDAVCPPPKTDQKEVKTPPDRILRRLHDDFNHRLDRFRDVMIKTVGETDAERRGILAEPPSASLAALCEVAYELIGWDKCEFPRQHALTPFCGHTLWHGRDEYRELLEKSPDGMKKYAELMAMYDLRSEKVCASWNGSEEKSLP